MRVVTPEQVGAAMKKQSEEAGKRIGEILVEMGAATPAQVTEALAKQFNFPYVDLKLIKVNPEITNIVKRETCEEHGIFPISMNGKALTVAISDPVDMVALENLKFILNTEIICALSPKPEIMAAIDKFYGTKQQSELMGAIDDAAASTEVKLRGSEVDLETVDPDKDDAPVIKFVQLMIAEAVKNRASDIHVEPMEDRVRIRYRVDGQCYEVNAPPKRLQGAVLSRIKILAEMDIAEKRKPQDGRIKIHVSGRELDIRVSALPATHGESIVMRLLDKQAGLVGMEELGFYTTDYKRFKSIIKRPNGIVLVTGPTGSGKTTTLYAALKELNRPDVKIITAENPVEYNLSGINQAQVKAHIGMTFQRILRAMLRQAPNIILVGEIRDAETAEIAIQAALTGHLVFSTLHTNDAPGALTRLIDMGVKPFLVASSIQAIMAQRLVRVLCPKCKEPNPEPDLLALAALSIKPEDLKGRAVWRAVGCDACKNTGFKGRKGIFELMELSSTLREMVFRKETTSKIKEQARLSGGMVTLLEDGVRKVFDGITTPEEVMTLTHREDISY
ncbi:MAG: type II/IV secretion system protein [Planctomycetes bacterium]|nr:type II/IV secretion system protein [Planctomycetota bacterium]